MQALYEIKRKERKKAKDGHSDACKSGREGRSSKGDGEAASEQGKGCACLSLGKKALKKLSSAAEKQSKLRRETDHWI